MKSPCMGCNNRVLGCHSNCEAYGTYKNDNEKRKQIELENKKTRDFYFNVSRFSKSVSKFG